MAKKEIIGLATDDQIKLWKNKHRIVKAIELTDEGQTFVCYVARPDMETMSAVAKVGKVDEMKAAEILFENCWLGGADVIKNDAALKLAVIVQLNSLISSFVVDIKNL